MFDPRALHSILVADMEHFPKELAPIKYVLISQSDVISLTRLRTQTALFVFCSDLAC